MKPPIKLTPVLQARLEQEVARREQEDSKDPDFADMRGMSQRTLQEYWDNDEDALYDTL